jgi:methylenetetrahydrofolate reductase (NADH)
MTPLRFEVMPFGDVAEQAAQLVSPAWITVTCSPRHGIDETVSLAERLADLGHCAVPHIAARRLRGRAHLAKVLRRLRAAQIDEALVIGGDGAPEGPYDTALAVLRELAEFPSPPAASVAAYPEGHPLATPELLLDALRAKQVYATAMTTQMCFSGPTLIHWLRRLRSEGIYLPAWVGVPGEVERRKLLEISLKIGVGPSARYIRKQPGALRRLLIPAGDPATAVRNAALAGDEDRSLGIAGLHVFTFNRLAASVTSFQQEAAASANEACS